VRKDGLGVAIRLPHDALGLVRVEEPIVLEGARVTGADAAVPIRDPKKKKKPATESLRRAWRDIKRGDTC
jgi:hypothetical protein